MYYSDYEGDGGELHYRLRKQRPDLKFQGGPYFSKLSVWADQNFQQKFQSGTKYFRTKIPVTGPNSSIKCKARITAEQVPAKAPLPRYHNWRRISAHSSSASRLDTNFWRTSVIAISIAADPSVDIEATHPSLPPMPVIVDFVIVKPNQMMPPLFSVCCVYVVCVCVRMV